MGYIVTYETMGRNEQFSKQVRQVSESSLMVTALEEEVRKSHRLIFYGKLKNSGYLNSRY